MRDSTRNTLTLILALAFICSLYPLTASFADIGFGSSPYSPHNGGHQGTSALKNSLKRRGYKTKTIISSLKVLSRINKTGVLMVVGPTKSYATQEVLNILLDFVYNGGSILLADDFGSGNSLLQSLWELLPNEVSIQFNTSSVLCDAENYQKTPARPSIQNFRDPYGIFEEFNIEEDHVQTSFPTTFGLQVNGTTTVVPSELGFLSSGTSSWLESDLSSARRGKAKPSSYEWGGIKFSLGLAFPSMAEGGRILVLSDPDIFSNHLIRKQDNSNMVFATDVISWLSQTTSSKVIFFDESHHSFLPFDPFFGFNLWFSVLTMFSSSWIIAPLIPFLGFIFIMGYLPNRKSFRPVTLRHKARLAKGTSLYRSKVKRYLESKNYQAAATNLLNLLTRRIARAYSIEIDDPTQLDSIILQLRPDLNTNEEKSLKKMVDLLKKSLREEKKISKREFTSLMVIYKELKGKLFP